MRLCDDYQPEPEHILRPPFDGSGIIFGLGADEWGLFKLKFPSFESYPLGKARGTMMVS